MARRKVRDARFRGAHAGFGIVLETRLHWLGHRCVPFPPFILQLDVLKCHAPRVRIKLRKCLIFRNPATINVVSQDDLSSLVHQLDSDVLAEVFEGDFAAKSLIEAPDLVGPFFEFRVVGYPSLKDDRFIFSPTGRLVAGTWISPLAMSYDFGFPDKGRDLTDPSDVFAVPIYSELEILVGVLPEWIYRKFYRTRFSSVRGNTPELLLLPRRLALTLRFHSPIFRHSS